MAQSKAKTVDEYLAELPESRRETVEGMRKIVLDNLPVCYHEAMQYGMISYVIPLERYPKTYNSQPLAIVSLASQKSYVSLYLMGIYFDGETGKWFTEGFRASGKRLDMGKSCLRFKRLEDLPLDLVGEAIARTTVDEFIERYEASRRLTKSSSRRR